MAKLLLYGLESRDEMVLHLKFDFNSCEPEKYTADNLRYVNFSNNGNRNK